MPYRVPLFELLAERHDLEVLCFGGGDRYVPSWFRGEAPEVGFRVSSLSGPAGALSLGRRFDAVIAPFAGGAVLPAAYFGARRFVLWASVWAEPRSFGHSVARPVVRRIYRRADAVVAYGEHVRQFVAGIRGRDDDVFVAPQSVEPLFARPVAPNDLAPFRGDALYVGRLVPEKGVDVLLSAWEGVDGTLVVIGDGPLADRAQATPGVRFLGPVPRSELPAAYAASSFAVLPSVPTPRFVEPWGLVCNEAMHQGRPMIASSSVGAVAGGLVVDGSTGLVVPPDDVDALRAAIVRLLGDDPLRARLGAAAREAVAPYTYEAMADAFDRALAVALDRG